MATAGKRASKKANRRAKGGHTGADHVEGETCRICKPQNDTAASPTSGQLTLLTRRTPYRSPLADVPGGALTLLAEAGKAVRRRG